MAVIGLFWFVGGVLTDHFGNIWLGIVTFSAGVWAVLVTVAVSAAFHLT